MNSDYRQVQENLCKFFAYFESVAMVTIKNACSGFTIVHFLKGWFQ